MEPEEPTHHLTQTSTPTGGTFRLTIGSQISDELPYDATPEEVNAMIDHLYREHKKAQTQLNQQLR